MKKKPYVTKEIKFSDDYPCGPCPEKWESCECECGWKYKEDEIINRACAGECEVCQYCGAEKCPKCGQHLHCGGCV